MDCAIKYVNQIRISSIFLYVNQSIFFSRKQLNYPKYPALLQNFEIYKKRNDLFSRMKVDSCVHVNYQCNNCTNITCMILIKKDVNLQQGAFGNQIIIIVAHVIYLTHTLKSVHKEFLRIFVNKSTSLHNDQCKSQQDFSHHSYYWKQPCL